MRRMISDKQLNELKSKNLKIIELDTSITDATITQEQMDIFFPKDAQGNIHKPDYDIVIADTVSSTSGSGGYAYLGYWNPTSIRFNRFGTNRYYTCTIGPNDTKFTQTRTEISKENIKIIELDGYISNVILTQNQLDIIFPKDSQGNIHKPDYDIIIKDKLTLDSYGYYYLTAWNPSGNTQFKRSATNSFYIAQITTSSNKFTVERIPLAAALYQHNIYIKTNELYIFLTLVNNESSSYTTMTNISGWLSSAHVPCSGYLQTGGSGPITSLYFNLTDNKYYFSLGADGKDYAFFNESDVREFTDEMLYISQ